MLASGERSEPLEQNVIKQLRAGWCATSFDNLLITPFQG
jgi:hypothetical protein